MADTFEKFTRNAKVCGHLVLDCALRVADWLSRQTPIIWTFEQFKPIMAQALGDWVGWIDR